MIERVNLHDAKTHLSRYVSELKAGESLILCNRNRPVAELRRLPSKIGKPRIGATEDEFVVPDAFFESLPEEIQTGFGEAKS